MANTSPSHPTPVLMRHSHTASARITTTTGRSPTVTSSLSTHVANDRNATRRDRADPNIFLLSKAQQRWLLDGVKNTEADFIFLISPDPWVIYHTAAHVGGDDKDDKGDGFPSFLHQRERLLTALDALDKPVLIFTGDVHASASVQIYG